MSEEYFVGFDIGSVSIGTVILDDESKVIHRDYRFHNGRIFTTLKEMISLFPVDYFARIGVNERGREFFREGYEINEQIGIIEGVKRVCSGFGSIITIGGETFGLILFDDSGNYRKYISNSACAAGTGAFLDQQAIRLGLSDSSRLAELALQHQDEPPLIATRCAVFAKTDLIHAQQQGYTLSAIADGLCSGVVHNVLDTLFHGTEVKGPIVGIGGVLKNARIVHYLKEVSGYEFIVPEAPEIVPALGIALLTTTIDTKGVPDSGLKKEDFLRRQTTDREYYYPPLFSETETEEERVEPEFRGDVELTIESDFRPGEVVECYLGMDIGSTSTKAVLMGEDERILATFYTRTAGQPVKAVQRITSCIQEIERELGVKFQITGAGTTGSGRKFIKKVTSADYDVDEITAHARAAYHLNPEIDTIIEIGGQDSKFTVMKDGNVTFSIMNYVCAAGTGSFLEEQANRLGVDLKDYSRLAERARAPQVSDRCTVFMERDLNHLLSRGYSREELLAAALHSVRDNYLSKVAHLNKIGDHIAFQGATGRNRALVKAFEQKLKKKIYVSKYCHLTGALGVCLKLKDEGFQKPSAFRKNIHQTEIQTEEEVCNYCKNHCKIKKINLDGEVIGWGYLCGRDETIKGYKGRIEKEFDLLYNRRKTFQVPLEKDSRNQNLIKLFYELSQGNVNRIIRKPYFSWQRIRNHIEYNIPAFYRDLLSSGIESRRRVDVKFTVAIPECFTLIDQVPLWRLFFEQLGVKVILLKSRSNSIKLGKSVERAEFCAPIANLHGVIKSGLKKADFIFLPHLFENPFSEEKGAYCYYTNYATALLYNIPELNMEERLIAPMLDLQQDRNVFIRNLYESFPETLKEQIPFSRVDEAFNLSYDWYLARLEDLKELFLEQKGLSSDVSVVLLGRPYIILDSVLNKGIPEKLTELGIRTFSMDMIPINKEELPVSGKLLDRIKWYYGQKILSVAETIAREPALFPIYLTAFKCAPDSFLIPYFKQIMDAYQKPYQLLQIDEHHTGEGYETRLEAAIRTFRNSIQRNEARSTLSFNIVKKLSSRTYLLPHYDPVSGRLLEAVFRHHGYQALMLEETPETIKSSSQLNDGQCFPINAIAQAIVHTMEKYNLKPDKTAVFINSESDLTCNLPQYPLMIGNMLKTIRPEFSWVQFLVTRFAMTDLPLNMLLDIYQVYLFSGLLQKCACKIRPYARDLKAFEQTFQTCLNLLYNSLLKDDDKEAALRRVVANFKKIKLRDVKLPRIGLVGDLYVRDNDTFNQGVVRKLESIGCEVVHIPFIDGIKLLLGKHFQSRKEEGEYLNLFRDLLTYESARLFSRKYEEIASEILENDSPRLKHSPDYYLRRYHLNLKHSGETVENLLKIFYIYETYPDVKLILHLNPIFCCPGLVSEAIFKKVEEDLGIPIVSITYDGTQSRSEEILKPYLHFIARIYQPEVIQF